MTSEKQRPECTEPRLGALLVSYTLGTLSEGDAEQFEQHLLFCPACQQELEEVSDALQTLFETREEIVHRAHAEREDFESQYERLLQAKQREESLTSSEKSQPWLEVLWLFLWGRRWVLGSVAAVVFAVLVGIKQAPELLPQHANDRIAPPAGNSQGQSTIEPRTEVPMESGELTAKKQTADAAPENLTKLDRPQPSPAASQSEPTRVSEKSSALHSAGGAKGESAAEIPPSLADQIGSAPLQNEEHIVSSAKSLMKRPSQRRVGDSTDLDAVAQLALGDFNPADYHYSKFRDAGKVGYYAIAPEKVFSKEESSEGRQSAVVTADSLLATGHYREARDIYQQDWSNDSTDVALGIMTGVAALAEGDPDQAGAALNSTYSRMSPGLPRLEVALLLARADILRDRVGEARVWLREAASSPADSQLSATAQRALIVLDSIQSAAPPDSSRK